MSYMPHFDQENLHSFSASDFDSNTSGESVSFLDMLLLESTAVTIIAVEFLVFSTYIFYQINEFLVFD